MKKKLVALMLTVTMIAGLASGCGSKASDSADSTESIESTEATEVYVPAHQAGETFTENLNGTDVAFTMMDFDRAGVVLPVPTSLLEQGRYRGGVASEDDWNNYIIVEPEDSEYQYYDASGYFLYVAGYAVGEEGCIYTGADGKTNITDTVTLSDAQANWCGENDAFTLTTEPAINNFENGTLSVSFDTPLSKTATLNGAAAQHTWQGEYYALLNGKQELNMIFGNASLDAATVKAVGDFMVQNMIFETKTEVAAGNEDYKSDLTTMNANGTDVNLAYTDVDGMTLLTDDTYFTFDYTNDLMEAEKQNLYRNDRAFLYTVTGISGISKETLATITDMASCSSALGQMGLYNYSGDNFAMTTKGDYTYMTFDGSFSVDGIDYQTRFNVMTNSVSTYVLVIGFKPDGGDLTALRNTISDSCCIKNAN